VAAQGAERSVRDAHQAGFHAFIGRSAFAESHRRQESRAPPAQALIDRCCQIAPMNADAFCRAKALEEKAMRNKPEPTVTMTAPVHELLLHLAAICAV